MKTQLWKLQKLYILSNFFKNLVEATLALIGPTRPSAMAVSYNDEIKGKKMKNKNTPM